MNVVYVSNDNYAKFFGISMLSLLENNRDIEELNIYYLQDGVSEENIAKIDDVASRYGRKVTYIDAAGFMDNFSVKIDTCGFSPVALARLFLTLYLPESVHQLIYLDCDTIIDGSLKELDNMDFEGNLVCLVPELLMHDEYKAELGLSHEDTYFNTGLMVVNLDAWREMHIENAFVDYYAEKDGKVLYVDQDITNHVCRGRIKPLPLKFNYGTNTPFFPKWFLKKLHPEFNLDEKPAMIHFMGDERPWVRGNINRFRKVFYKYRDMSPWKDFDLIEGKELYLFCYHCLNLITLVSPHFRVWFSRNYGLRLYERKGSKS